MSNTEPPITFEQYLEQIPLLHSWDNKTWNTGGFFRPDLSAFYNFLRNALPPDPVLLETGAGNSTIAMLFLNPAKLISIAPDAELYARIRNYCRHNGISDAALDAHIDGSQWVLPALALEARSTQPILDFALIDGCHGWPTAFVDLEYINSMMRQGGYLMIDDLQLHAEKEIARLILEHPVYSPELGIGKWLIFRKVRADRDLGDWIDQPYIVRRTKEYDRYPNPCAIYPPNNLHLARAQDWLKHFPARVRSKLQAIFWKRSLDQPK